MKLDLQSPDNYSLCLISDYCDESWHFWEWFAAIALWFGDKVAGPAIVAVLFAGLTSYALERARAKRDVIVKLSEQIRQDLNSLQALIMEYYARKSDKLKDPQIEAQIIVLDREITGAMRIYCEHSSALRAIYDIDAASEEFSLAVMPLESFQSFNRRPDTNSLRIALDAISGVRATLTNARLSAIKSIWGG